MTLIYTADQYAHLSVIRPSSYRSALFERPREFLWPFALPD